MVTFGAVISADEELVADRLDLLSYIRSFSFFAPMMLMVWFPDCLKALTTGYMSARPMPPPMLTTLP